MSETLNIINSLNNEFTEHIKAEAGDKLGHVITGGDIVFSGGIGTVVSAGKVKINLLLLVELLKEQIKLHLMVLRL